MKHTRWIYAVLLASAFAFTACDDDDDNIIDDDPSLNAADKTFLENAARANMTEIEFGTLPADKGSDSLVVAFAQHMIDEHTTAQDELEDIRDDYDNIDWPEEMDQEHLDIMSGLDTLEGYQFDSLYIASQVMDHEAAESLFQNASDNATETQIKSYAAKYLPHIQEHLSRADSVQSVLATRAGTN